jgi:hypothetical protein
MDDIDMDALEEMLKEAEREAAIDRLSPNTVFTLLRQAAADYEVLTGEVGEDPSRLERLTYADDAMCHFEDLDKLMVVGARLPDDWYGQPKESLFGDPVWDARHKKDVIDCLNPDPVLEIIREAIKDRGTLTDTNDPDRVQHLEVADTACFYIQELDKMLFNGSCVPNAWKRAKRD